MTRSATAFAPASVGNAGVGFDIMGFAVRACGDTVRVQRGAPGVRILDIEGVSLETKLPKDPEKNTATAGLVALSAQLPFGFDVTVQKGIPLSSGLGGSAASAVAGVFAASAVLDSPLSREDMMRYAMIGEAIASGAEHGDNVAPSLCGGLMLIRKLRPLDMFALPVPKGVHCALVHPQIRIDTKAARAVLPAELSLSTCVAHSAELASFVAACYRGEAQRFAESCKDLLAAPHRRSLIPGYDDAERAALSAGAWNFTISGAGPTVFSLCSSEEKAQTVQKAIGEAFANKGLGVDAWCTEVGTEGARLVASS